MNTNTTSSRERQQQARNRALDRAQAQAALGNLPTLVATRFDGSAIHETWRVMSRTYDGVAYTVELSHDYDSGTAALQAAQVAIRQTVDDDADGQR